MPIFFAYLNEISFQEDFYDFHLRVKALFHPADSVLKLSLRFFKKSSINQFNHQSKEKHALFGA